LKQKQAEIDRLLTNINTTITKDQNPYENTNQINVPALKLGKP